MRYGSTDAQGFTEPGGYNSNYLAVALSGVNNFPITMVDVASGAGVKAEETGPSYRASISWRPSRSLTT